MLALRLTPKVILTALVPQLAVMLLLHLGTDFGWWPHSQAMEWLFRNSASIFAYVVALALSLEVAGEYRGAPLLRVAWLALAANAGISVVRMILEGPWIGLLWSGYDRALRGLCQHLAIVPANVALLIGVLAMCLAYHRVGLGFEVARRDYALMGMIAAVLIALLTFRSGLTEAQSPYLTGRYLQQTGLVLLALVSAVSVLLHRMALQMGGGQLARVLMLLTLYALARSTVVLLGALRRTLRPTAGFFIDCLIELAWTVIVWLPALAAAYRAQMTVSAAKELNERRLARGTTTVA